MFLFLCQTLNKKKCKIKTSEIQMEHVTEDKILKKII